MTEDVFKAKVEEYRKKWPGKEYKHRTESWAMADLLQDMYNDLRRLSSEGFIEKYSWVERLLFEKPLEPVEDRGDNVLNNAERYDYYRLFHYDTGYVYFTGPTFIYFLLNFIKETERIKKESERREKLINNVLYRRNETSDKINRIHEYIQDSYKDDKADEITAVLNYIKTAINNLFNDTIDMSNLLIENNDRLDHIEKIVASIAPVIEHATRKIDESYARISDLDAEEGKFLGKLGDIAKRLRVAVEERAHKIDTIEKINAQLSDLIDEIHSNLIDKVDTQLFILGKGLDELRNKVEEELADLGSKVEKELDEVKMLRSKIEKEVENSLGGNNTVGSVDAKVETKARKTNLLDKIIRIVKKEAL